MLDDLTAPLDPFATRLIHSKALELVRKANLPPYECVDIAQDLAVRLMVRLRRRNPALANNRAYLRTAIRRLAISWLRSYYAAKNQCESLDDDDDEDFDDDDGELVLFIETIPTAQRARHRNFVSTDAQAATELAHDVQQILPKLPEELREVCERLMNDSPTDIPLIKNMTRRQMESSLRQIKEHFEAAGFDGHA